MKELHCYEVANGSVASFWKVMVEVIFLNAIKVKIWEDKFVLKLEIEGAIIIPSQDTELFNTPSQSATPKNKSLCSL